MGEDDGHEWKIPKGRHRHRIDNCHYRLDIATDKNFNKAYNDNLTTYIFTDFPNNFGAKSLFNAFHHYGDIKEVVIPAKRDKGGKRFGFACFDRVNDPGLFATELDTIIIGRNKISMNLSRFQRSEGNKHSGERRLGKKGGWDNNRSGYVTRNNIHSTHQQVCEVKEDSYAQAVRRGGVKGHVEKPRSVALAYEVEENDMARLKNAFVGVVENPGMTYNIQNAFHSQGYFSVKVTPLGSNLTLLEGQEEGEVQALMDDANEWLNQWFRVIRPWNPKDVDMDRIVWLRVFGIPAHAWNDNFFAQISKPWGCFMNADDTTSKKLSMDVARLLIRTSCHKPVDEFIDVKINGELFHLRVVEDSYGPMRLMVPQTQGQNGRANSDDDDDEEEEGTRWLAVEEEVERDSEGECENLIALNSCVNANNHPLNVFDQVEVTNEHREERVENSNKSFNEDSNFNSKYLNSMEGCTDVVGGGVRKDSLSEIDGEGMGQVDGEGGPTLTINSNQIVIGGDILCCSSIKSAEIRNCNKKFLNKYEQEVASKVWKGAVELGVGENSLVGRSCMKKGIKGSTMEECIQELGSSSIGRPFGRVELEGKVVYIVNIYSPCNLSGKKKLWEELVALKNQSDGGEWCLGGDFNAVLHQSERKGSSADSRQGERDLFNSFVEEMEVTDVPVLGKKAYILKEKFRMLKECLRQWNREVFGFLDLNIEKTVKDLNDIEGMLRGDETDLELIRREGLNKEFWKQLHLKESLLKQKSRLKWVKEGDSNTRFFHESIKCRRRRNQIVALKDGEQWIQGVEEVKGYVQNYFENNFKERWESRPILSGLQFQSLSAEDKFMLTAPFSIEEVREAIWCSDGNKCPGPDSTAILPKAFTASFLTIIPKKDHPQCLSDYRPICLVSCVYKILSKTWLKEEKDKCLFFKVDFERAYDTVNWKFLEYMMVRMGFSELWRQWMQACIFQSTMSVIVNGSPTGDFKVGKGLRQGDPLSPFLFLIVAEGLTGLMNKAVENGRFHGYKVSNNILFHTLQFADDTIIMGDGNWDNLWTIKIVLRSFEIVSGLKVNFYKSKLYGINLIDSFLRASSSFLHCGVESIPFRFLGIPVGANPRRKATWSPILDSMKKDLVIGMLRRAGVLKELVSIQRRFLWAGGLDNNKICWVSWERICQSKENGDTVLLEKIFYTEKGGMVLRKRLFGGGIYGGTTPLRDLFPSLYVKSSQANGLISAMGIWDHEIWTWKLEWTDLLSVTETTSAHDLWLILDQVRPSRIGADRRRWKPHVAGVITVNTAYAALEKRSDVVEMQTNTAKALKFMWKNNVPSKVSIFGWRLLIDKLPTKEALYNRGVITNILERCVLCHNDVEDINHIFFICTASEQVVQGVMLMLISLTGVTIS
ncbi:hypothetical protein TSUD_380010 [Trifolium subterraneum]|uniref:Reverse transcriptase domain-containing protein n=1 Tax=Trifolium subterraneum TaxID=3900 RepID=A0A2Z6MXN2_TRISU|nr:hypothetical protein TSUD_380010 [Trifolium subterraneum]